MKKLDKEQALEVAKSIYENLKITDYSMIHECWREEFVDEEGNVGIQTITLVKGNIYNVIIKIYIL